MKEETEKVELEEKDVQIYRYGEYTVRIHYTGEKTFKECLENIVRYAL